MKFTLCLFALAAATTALEGQKAQFWSHQAHCRQGEHYLTDGRITPQKAAMVSAETGVHPFGSVQDDAWYGSAHSGSCQGDQFLCTQYHIWGAIDNSYGYESQWMVFDFEGTKTIDMVMIDHWGGSDYWNHAPKDVEVQIGNSIHGPWSTCSAFATEVTCMPVYYPVEPCTGTAVRLYMHNKHLNDSPWWVLDEVIFYGPTATPSPTNYPTPSPTNYPTPSPTNYPTPYPTPAQCTDTWCQMNNGFTDVYTKKTEGGTGQFTEKWHCMQTGNGCECFCDPAHSQQCTITHNGVDNHHC